MFDLTPFSARRLSLPDPLSGWSGWPAWLSGEDGPARFFRTDIRDLGDSYLLEAELPGCAKDDVEVTVERDRLTITARRQQDSSAESEGYLRRERLQGVWQRSFDLSGVDADSITAACRDGVLSLTLPKQAEQPAARRLEID